MTALLVVAAVAAVAVAGMVVASLAFARSIRGMERQHARERELLLNQVCNLAGKPWTPAPADEYQVPSVVVPLITSPEQLADF